MKKSTNIPPLVYATGTQMTTLASAHFMADMLGGLLPGFLPKALEYFQINLSMGVFILTSMSIGCNIMQIPVAWIGREIRKPWLISLGLLMAGLILLIGTLPSSTPVILLCLLMLTVGAGVAIVHPSGLRGVQNLTKIAPSVGTPTFMTGGFLGSCIGPWLSAVLVTGFGLKGLLLLFPLVLLLIAAVHLSHIRLALDHIVKSMQNLQKDSRTAPWSFSSLILIATLLNTGTATIQLLLPTLLNNLGFSLSFGGMSAMFFGIGSATGSILLGFLVKKHHPEWFFLSSLALGIPTVVCYLLILNNSVACLLIVFAGMFASSGYPLLVALSRNAPDGPGLSTRMALIVGGSWGTAGLLFLVIGQIASIIGIYRTMNAAWIFYLLAFLAAAFTLRQNRSKEESDHASEQHAAEHSRDAGKILN